MDTAPPELLGVVAAQVDEFAVMARVEGSVDTADDRVADRRLAYERQLVHSLQRSLVELPICPSSPVSRIVVTTGRRASLSQVATCASQRAHADPYTPRIRRLSNLPCGVAERSAVEGRRYLLMATRRDATWRIDDVDASHTWALATHGH